MKISEVNQDIFTVPQGYYLAHCIDGEFTLGAGIAKQFDLHFGMKEKLSKQHAGKKGEVGVALKVDNVFNLVIKHRCYDDADYDDIENAFWNMRKQVDDFDIMKLAIPRIASGKEGLDWNKVRELLEYVFEDSDIEFLVCQL